MQQREKQIEVVKQSDLLQKIEILIDQNILNQPQSRQDGGKDQHRIKSQILQEVSEQLV